jgi:hypothetical protein
MKRGLIPLDAPPLGDLSNQLGSLSNQTGSFRVAYDVVIFPYMGQPSRGTKET